MPRAFLSPGPVPSLSGPAPDGLSGIAWVRQLYSRQVAHTAFASSSHVCLPARLIDRDSPAHPNLLGDRKTTTESFADVQKAIAGRCNDNG